jgi:predicted nuclease with TOPRIM domain
LVLQYLGTHFFQIIEAFGIVVTASASTWGVVKGIPLLQDRKKIIHERDKARDAADLAVALQHLAENKAILAEQQAKMAAQREAMVQETLDVVKESNDALRESFQQLIEKVDSFDDKIALLDHKLVVAVRYICDLILVMRQSGKHVDLPAFPTELEEDIKNVLGKSGATLATPPP